MAKQKRITLKVPDPNVVFLVAEQYWKIGQHLAGDPIMGEVYLPVVVCSAFSLELYFKCRLYDYNSLIINNKFLEL